MSSVEISPEIARTIDPRKIAQIQLADGTLVRISNQTVRLATRKAPRRAARKAPLRASGRRSTSVQRVGQERMSFGRVVREKRNYNLYEECDLKKKQEEAAQNTFPALPL